jgi:hypothetical protein
VKGNRGRYVGEVGATDLGNCVVSDVLLYTKCMLSYRAIRICNFNNPEKFVNPQSSDDLNTKKKNK